MLKDVCPSLKKKLGLLVVLGVILFISFYDPNNSQLNIEDALFLTRNSIKEIKEQYFHPKKGGEAERAVVASSDSQLEVEEVDYPISNMVNSIFPIDSTISFNVSGEFMEFNGRYASFSPILNFPLTDHYRIWNSSGCHPSKDRETDLSQYRDKIIVILRGECTFVQKVQNLISYDLSPKAIIVANNEPHRGLITMYSNTFNEDRTLTIPVMFITKEAYDIFHSFNVKNALITISTTSLGNWLNIVISMMLSPPLLILLFYGLVQFIQQFRRIQRSKSSKKMVQNLPVFIYNKNHLVDSRNFYRYLNDTGQRDVFLNDNSLGSSSNESLSSAEQMVVPKPTPSSSDKSLNDFKINGLDVRKKAKDLNILLMHQDFYPTFKCSICLDRFKPLKSRVLVLQCKHFFHEACLSNWLINFRRSCPLCNNAVVGNVSNSLIAGQSSNSYGSVDEESSIGLEQQSQASEGTSVFAPNLRTEQETDEQASEQETQDPTQSSESERTEVQNWPVEASSTRTQRPTSSVAETFVTAPRAPATASVSTRSYFSAQEHSDDEFRTSQPMDSEILHHDVDETISNQSTISSSNSTIDLSRVT